MEELFIRHYRMETSSSDTSSDASIVHPYKNSQAKQAAGGCQPHGNLTPAHADGCAARCFEGVQCGSIFKGASGRGQQNAALFLNNACFAPSHTGDHGGRCSLAHTGTNVPVCSIPCRNRSPFQCATSAPYQPASAIKDLMADAHSRRGNRGGDAERKHTAAAKQGEAMRFG